VPPIYNVRDQCATVNEVQSSLAMLTSMHDDTHYRARFGTCPNMKFHNDDCRQLSSSSVPVLTRGPSADPQCTIPPNLSRIGPCMAKLLTNQQFSRPIVQKPTKLLVLRVDQSSRTIPNLQMTQANHQLQQQVV